MTTRIRVTTFASAMHMYVSKQLKKANADRSAWLTAAEAAALPKDLRDNFEATQKTRVSPRKFENAMVVGVWAAAEKADRNHDGFLSATEAKALPALFRDNYRNYVKSLARP